MPRKIILDCDPGHDDAIAILLAHGNPEIELLAVTTVVGNQTLAKLVVSEIEADAKRYGDARRTLIEAVAPATFERSKGRAGSSFASLQLMPTRKRDNPR